MLNNLKIKIMKKITGLLMMLLMVASFTYAQDAANSNYHYKNAIDIAYETSYPMGSFSDAAGASWFGTTARYEFSMGKAWVGMITTGYLTFADGALTDNSAVPLMIGTKLHFTPGWYGMVETGLHFMSQAGDNSTEWGYSVGTGYEIPLGKVLSLDLSTKYQYNTNNFSYWNTRLGLMFKF